MVDSKRFELLAVGWIYMYKDVLDQRSTDWAKRPCYLVEIEFLDNIIQNN